MKTQMSRTSRAHSNPGQTKLYTLDFRIIGGPMTEEFDGAVVSRRIQIRGDQTLKELHGAIFDAFDREDEHLYEFQFGGKRPMDPNARRYVLPSALEDQIADRERGGDLTRMTVGALGLDRGSAFYYWFDYGDDWMHQACVVAIEDATPGEYPRIIERVGESPPQYVDWDEVEEG
jgi:Plasmid pRiA4b ORF-3-like protein